ncbi:hypothetical protein TVAG_373270 [Trichomonas vaginalis G3]|uniref:Ubiquitin-like domain-containing protein n=1 Tax=Trichomonas vaginalis (strain ATCC PRA-98 / G3) TaxID=412133 RepID=A2DZJ0_TRIV3|nr:hypothetical protein TVAGG3_0011920 [Trichomonas vaginalis G3]EAY14194.1 hypothetical protein TVAG_373270 [Trichomonas vaginalis G3]KAI5539189.1 hypothetical protein TVAGG3_0011920 [Trichomonas vaginalis G3]|eukprot:XP_001326417.1 hypothetical protein [Trichomonas vaginalis G3]
MRIYVTQPKQSRIAIEADPSISLDSLKEILIKDHKYMDGTYVFIQNGKIFPFTTHLDAFKEDSIIFIYIKDPFPPGEKSVPLDADYFYSHPEEVQRLLEVFEARNIESVILTAESRNISLQNIQLIGLYPRIGQTITSDYDANLMQLSDKQRQDFQRVLQFTRDTVDRDVALQTFIACDHNPDLTLNCL